ncbi:MAG: hypothetical protein GC154_13700 [bacterium]|nr:hypothetical protein [bacterium]
MHIKTSDQPSLELGFGGYTCNWGAHICGLYETESERDEIIFGFLAAGFANQDVIGFCPSERSTDSFKEQFAARYPEYASRLDNPASITLVDPQSLYYANGAFSPYQVENQLAALYRQFQANGARNIRTAAEMTWALRQVPGREHLMAYEARLNRFYTGKPWVSLCLYNLTRFDGTAIMDVLHTHPYAISGGVITQNPFYQAPKDWLAEHAPDFLFEFDVNT